EQEREDGVDAGALVVEQDRGDEEDESDRRGEHALADRVASERRADGALLERRQRRRQRAAAQQQRQIAGRLLREVAADDALAARDLLVDDRGGDDLVVEDDRELALHVLPRERAELRPALRSQRERDDRLADVTLVDARGLQIAAADRHVLVHRDVLDADGAADLVFLAGRKDVDVRTHRGGSRVERGLRRREGAAFHDAELQLRRRLDDVLHARRIVDARELDVDAVLALEDDDRLRHAERVDAAADRLDRLLDRVALQLRRSRRLQMQTQPFRGALHFERRQEVARDALVFGRADARRRRGDERRVIDAARHRHRQLL